MGARSRLHHPHPPVQEIRFWMSLPVLTTTQETTLGEALAVMHEHSVRRLPVVDANGRLRGMITDGDIRGAELVRAAGVELPTIAAVLCATVVGEVMAKHPIAVTQNATLREVAMLMLDNKVGGLPVVDEQNQVVGIITESDLFEALVCYLDREFPESLE
jgi:CBS domain-containing protein